MYWLTLLGWPGTSSATLHLCLSTAAALHGPGLLLLVLIEESAVKEGLDLPLAVE